MMAKKIGTRRLAKYAVVLLMAAVALALSACSDALLTEMSRLAGETNRPGIEPKDGAIITAHETVTLKFGKTMDRASVTISGDIGTPAKVDWATTTLTDDTLVLNDYTPAVPVISWSVGNGRQLIITVSSSGTSNSYTYTFEVFRGICVSAGGNDSNSGTAVNPKRNISAGIVGVQSAALYNGSGEVHAAEGAYDTNWYGNQNRIVMVEGISLKGGYAADWTALNPIQHISKITDNSPTGGTSPAETDPNRAVDCGAGLTNATTIEGFTINGGLGAFSAAVYCGTSSPIIQNNVIVSGGDETSSRRYGISISNGIGSVGSPRIVNNTINNSSTAGGINVDMSYGVFISSSGGGGTIEISGNYINAGIAATTVGSLKQSYGIWAQSGTPIISGNTIVGGQAENTYSVYLFNIASEIKCFNNLIIAGKNHTTGSSYSLYCRSSTQTIRNNTIISGDASTYGLAAYGIFLRGVSVANIDNNILSFIQGTDIYPSYGIYEYPAALTPASVKNNDFFNYPNDVDHTMYHDATNGDLKTVSGMESDLNAESPGSASNNTDVNPGWAADYTLIDSSNSTVKSGGIDGAAAGWGFSTDRAGATRTGTGTTGWSMGCYEKD
jgi:hypothetical protein